MNMCVRDINFVIISASFLGIIVMVSVFLVFHFMISELYINVRGNGQSRDIRNIGHKTQNGGKNKTTQKTKQMSNTDHTKKRGLKSSARED